VSRTAESVTGQSVTDALILRGRVAVAAVSKVAVVIVTSPGAHAPGLVGPKGIGKEVDGSRSASLLLEIEKEARPPLAWMPYHWGLLSDFGPVRGCTGSPDFLCTVRPYRSVRKMTDRVYACNIAKSARIWPVSTRGPVIHGALRRE